MLAQGFRHCVCVGGVGCHDDDIVTTEERCVLGVARHHENLPCDRPVKFLEHGRKFVPCQFDGFSHRAEDPDGSRQAVLPVRHDLRLEGHDAGVGLGSRLLLEARAHLRERVVAHGDGGYDVQLDFDGGLGAGTRGEYQGEKGNQGVLHLCVSSIYNNSIFESICQTRIGYIQPLNATLCSYSHLCIKSIPKGLKSKNFLFVV